MCICINCDYYLTCWMQNGIKILKPTDYKIKNFGLTQKKLPVFIKTTNVHLNLHFFTNRYIEEYDVNYCENFCENPGKWIL